MPLHSFRHFISRASRPVQVVAALALLLVATERKASAYTDPGSGALIWQMLVAGFVGLMFYLRRFSSWFHKKEKEPKD